MNLDFGRCLWKRENTEMSYRKLTENQRGWDSVDIPGKAFKAASTFVMFKNKSKEGRIFVLCLIYD